MQYAPQHAYACRTAIYFNNAGVTLLSRGHYLDAVDCFYEAVTLLSFCCIPNILALACPNATDPCATATILPLMYESIERKQQLVAMALANSRTDRLISSDCVNILSLDNAAEHYAEQDPRLTLIRIEELPKEPDLEHIIEILPACMLMNYAASYHLLHQTATATLSLTSPWKSTLFLQCCYTAPFQTGVLLDNAMHVLNIRTKLCSKNWTSITGSHLFVAVAILRMHPCLTVAERNILLSAAGEIFRAAQEPTGASAA